MKANTAGGFGLISSARTRVKHREAADALLAPRRSGRLWLRTGTPTDILPGYPEVQGAFKDLMTHCSCDSHYLSHFAAFFIVVGAKTSIAESVYTLFHCSLWLLRVSESNKFVIKRFIHHTRKWIKWVCWVVLPKEFNQEKVIFHGTYPYSSLPYDR